MLFVNNVLIDPQGNKPIEKEVNSQMKEIDKLLKQGRGYIRFRYPPEKVKRDKSVEVIKGPDRQRMTVTGIPLSCVVFDKKRGEETWAYRKSINKTDNKGNIVSKNITLTFNGSLFLEEKDKDLIFYLIFKSPSYKRIFEIESQAKDAKAIADQTREDILVKQHIYGNSPVNNDKDLRSIAKALNVPEVDYIQELDVVRREVLKLATENKGYFLELIENKKEIHLKAVIQQAIDERIIMFDDKKCHWVYPDKDHVLIELRVHQAGEKRSHIENYLKNNEKEFVFIEKSVKGNIVSDKSDKSEGENKEPDAQLIELYKGLGVDINGDGKVKRMVLINKAKELGLDMSGKVADLEERILNFKPE